MSNFEAESPKAHATRLLSEIEFSRGERAGKIALIAHAFREWEARGLEAMAESLAEVPAAAHLRETLLVRAKELRVRLIELA